MADYDWFDYREPRRIPEYEKWGFIGYYSVTHLLTCPACYATIHLGVQDIREETHWWKHVQWHERNGEEWPFKAS